MERWGEQVEMLEVELVRSERFFRCFAAAWMKLVDDAQTTPFDAGLNATCRKMHSMFTRYAKQCQKPGKPVPVFIDDGLVRSPEPATSIQAQW